ncbi:hypothetical protein GCM10008959_31820 [Deinococcus seoulensis]|uniref:DUF6927 domain-containing protein n=1 Tax=Deinococcus seoulensis TaxID=1837379 RepID=A0ABQ2RX07_9DEIO|nr:hypothetical protein [Deinococcus seoulensis]GGR67277.1 hypothetical protein GCM10008959_31820 [Deinococcus seoulensis]
MGTTTAHFPRGTSMPSFFYGTLVSREGGIDRYEKPWSGGVTVTEVAASALVGRAEFYVVMRYGSMGPVPFSGWFVAVYKVGWTGQEHENFWYRDLDESMNPLEARATKAVLTAAEQYAPLPHLSPEDDAAARQANGESRRAGVSYEAMHAARERRDALDPDFQTRRWRERCWEHVRQRERAARVPSGATVQFARGMTFTRGPAMDTFTLVRVGRRVHFEDSSGYHRYRIADWETMEYTVLAV